MPSDSVSSILQRLRLKKRSQASPFTKVPADDSATIRQSPNVLLEEGSKSTPIPEHDHHNVASQPDNSNNSQSPPGNTEKPNRVDSLPSPQSPRDSTDDPQVLAKNISPSQSKTTRESLVGAIMSDDGRSGSGVSAEERSMSEYLTSEEQAAQLWTDAYDRLRTKSPELVKAYSETVMEWFAINETYFEGRGRRPSAIDFSGTGLLAEGLSVRSPFDLVITVMRKETLPVSETNSKPFSKLETYPQAEQAPKMEPIEPHQEETGLSEAANEYSIGSEAARCLSEHLRKALEASPHASIAWAASFVTLQTLLRPVPHTDAMQILSVLSKMQWFTELFRIFFWPGQANPPIPSTSSPVDALIALYESVLAYHMRVAAELDTRGAKRQHQPDEPRLKMALNELQVCELQLVGTFDQLSLPPRPIQQSEDSTIPDKYDTLAESELRNAFATLSIDQQMIPDLDADKSYVLDRLYNWAKQTSDFQRFTSWDTENDLRLLWVCSPPGCGKSIFLQAAVQHLPKVPTSSFGMTIHVTCFFHAGAMRGQGNIVSILKTLISGVLLKQPDLVDHLTLVIDGRGGFDDEGGADALSSILYSMIQDRRFNSTYFVLDGVEGFTKQNYLSMGSTVDEMMNDSAQNFSELQRLITTTVRLSRKVKWLLSISIEDELHEADLTMVHGLQELSLSLDGSKHQELLDIAQQYASLKIANICKRTGYNDHIRRSLTRHIESARGNLLIFDTALDIIGAVSTPWNAIATLVDLIPDEPSIDRLYRWNYDHILRLPSEESIYFRAILSAVAAATYPITISELIALIELPPEFEPFLMIDKLLPAFLEVRKERIYFKHHSANKFIRRLMGESTLRSESAKIARQCLKLVLRSIRCSHMEETTDEKILETDSELTMIMWVKHLSTFGGEDPETMDLAVHLLSAHLIDWLRLLGARGLISETLYMMSHLNSVLENNTPEKSEIAAGITVQVFREATKFMNSYLQWSASPEEEEQPDEESSVMSPEQRLLFATDLPMLREKMLPAMFPMLQEAPALDGEGAWGECLHVLSHKDWVRGCCFSPDGQTVASASDEGLVRVWDVRRGSLQRVFRGFDHWCRSVTISPAPAPKDRESGGTIASFDNSTIRVWDSVTGKLLENLTQDEKPEIRSSVNSIALSRAADMLAAAVDDSVIIWQLPGATSYTTLDTRDGSRVRRIVFSPDGEFLAFASGSDITVRSIRQGATGAVCALPPGEPLEQDHTSSQDKDCEATEHAKAAEVHNTMNTELVQTGHSDDIDGLCFSSDSKFLVSGSDDTTARVWDIAKRQTVAILNYHWSYVNDVCFSHDNSLIATGSSDNTIALWKQKSPGSWGEGEKQTQPYYVLRGHDRGILSVSFSPLLNGEFLASTSKGGDLRIWDVEKINKMISEGKQPDVNNIERRKSAVTCVAISENGRVIASGSDNGTMCIWDSQTGIRQCVSKESHESEILSMTFSPDNQLLVTTSIDQTAYVWEVALSVSLLTPRLQLKHKDWVRDAQFDKEGRLVATACDDGVVRVYDVSAARTATGVVYSPPSTITLEAMMTFPGHHDYVYSVAFSPDSKRLASGSGDEHVMIWELDLDYKNGTLLHNMTSDKVDSSILGVQFLVDGTTVVSVSRGGTIAVWRPSETGDHQCQIVTGRGDAGRDTFMSMRIDPMFPDFLLTEVGAIPLNLSETEAVEHNERRPPGWPRLRFNKSEASIRYDYELGKENWTTGSSDRAGILHLPSQFTPTDEPYSCRVQGRMAVIGCRSGHVLILKFVQVE